MAAIVSLVSVRCHGHRLASASYYLAVDLYSMVLDQLALPLLSL